MFLDRSSSFPIRQLYIQKLTIHHPRSSVKQQRSDGRVHAQRRARGPGEPAAPHERLRGPGHDRHPRYCGLPGALLCFACAVFVFVLLRSACVATFSCALHCATYVLSRFGFAFAERPRAVSAVHFGGGRAAVRSGCVEHVSARAVVWLSVSLALTLPSTIAHAVHTIARSQASSR
jgi:hypothetical protein